MYKFSPKAKQDLKSITKYTTEQFGLAQSNQYLMGMKDVLTHLSQFPRMGRIRDEIGNGVLSYVYRSHTIFYRLHDQGIWILRILHQRMDHRSLM
ncbi:MAG: type II toxin-antitoxin system RelE/ParE family toxin [Pasteurellaceae bacterium]|nr:type II toxin-antitoxin system RelE/ParE family toxin [Pasteurellaceae bacterium]